MEIKVQNEGEHSGRHGRIVGHRTVVALKVVVYAHIVEEQSARAKARHLPELLRVARQSASVALIQCAQMLYQRALVALHLLQPFINVERRYVQFDAQVYHPLAIHCLHTHRLSKI